MPEEKEKPHSGQNEQQNEQARSEWDAAFPRSILLELRADKGRFRSETQKALGHFPIRSDMFIENLDPERPFQSVLGRRFRRWNFLEFKAPEDEMNLDTFVKGRVYAGLFKISAAQVDGYKMEDISFTFVRQRKPIKLMRELEERLGYRISREYPGIYYVDHTGREDYFFQIVVVRELDLEQCLWLGVVKRGITWGEFSRFAARAEALTDRQERQDADVINDVVVRANQKTVELWKGDFMMGNVLKELMQDVIDEAVEQAVEQAVRETKEEAEKRRATAVEQAVRETKEEAEKRRTTAVEQAVRETKEEAEKRRATAVEQAIRETKEEAERSKATAIEEAVEQAEAMTKRNTILSNLRSMVDTLKVTAEQAMNALQIPEESRAYYAARL